MTDIEVKKALEDTLHRIKGAEYLIVPKEGVENLCNGLQNALDLINRLEDQYRWLDQESDILRADVENLNRINDELVAENESLKAEVERLNNNISAMATTLSTSARATRHEAYKECIEKVTDKAELIRVNAFEGKWAISQDDLDNLLNELVGEENPHNIDKQN